MTLAQAGYELTAWGWFVMLVSVGFVTILLIWSIFRVMRESRSDKLHSQIDIEPEDKVKD